MAKILVFTGAGVSADSGVPTFRDSNGLWEGYKVEDVASPKGWMINPEVVWQFYKARYDELKHIQPNKAHYSIVDLERWCDANGHDFLLATQNIDGLHQKAGSQRVIELHGDLRNLRCETCDHITNEYEYWNEAEVPRCPICDDYLRVNVVWFGEFLNDKDLLKAELQAIESTIVLVIGTSGLVYPAAGLVSKAAIRGSYVYECNITPAFNRQVYDYEKYESFNGRASDTVEQACEKIIQKLRTTC